MWISIVFFSKFVLAIKKYRRITKGYRNEKMAH